MWENKTQFCTLRIEQKRLTFSIGRRRAHKNVTQQKQSTKLQQSHYMRSERPVTEHDGQINKLNPTLDKIFTDKNYWIVKLGENSVEFVRATCERRAGDLSGERASVHTRTWRNFTPTWKLSPTRVPIVPRGAPPTTWQQKFNTEPENLKFNCGC